MKKNKMLLIVFMFISIFILASCSSNYNPAYEGEDPVDHIVQLDALPDRKIIYRAEATLYVRDIEQSVEEIRLLLESDEWFDSENVSENSGYLIMRVKTARLDLVLASLKDSYDVSNYNKSATDISLEYQSATNKIVSYEAERAQLIILYTNASLSDMITINSRIAEIDLELGDLEGTLNQFDSLVEYSQITLNIRKNTVLSQLPFGTRIIDGLVNGFNALISFFDGLVIVLVTLIPWAIVFVPGGYGIYRLIKHWELKRMRKKEKQE